MRDVRFVIFVVVDDQREFKDQLPISSHKRQLIAEFYERDYPRHRNAALAARDFIIANNLPWEQARNVKDLSTRAENAEDVD